MSGSGIGLIFDGYINNENKLDYNNYKITIESDGIRIYKKDAEKYSRIYLDNKGSIHYISE